MDINESFRNFRNQFPSGRLLLQYSRRESEMSCPLISDLSRYLVIWIVSGPPEVIGLSIFSVIWNWPIHLAVAPPPSTAPQKGKRATFPGATSTAENAFSLGDPHHISFVYVAESHFQGPELLIRLAGAVRAWCRYNVNHHESKQIITVVRIHIFIFYYLYWMSPLEL